MHRKCISLGLCRNITTMCTDACRNVTIREQGVPGFLCRAIFGVREKILISGEIYTSAPDPSLPKNRSHTYIFKNPTNLIGLLSNNFPTTIFLFEPTGRLSEAALGPRYQLGTCKCIMHNLSQCLNGLSPFDDPTHEAEPHCLHFNHSSTQKDSCLQTDEILRDQHDTFLPGQCPWKWCQFHPGERPIPLWSGWFLSPGSSGDHWLRQRRSSTLDPGVCLSVGA